MLKKKKGWIMAYEFSRRNIRKIFLACCKLNKILQEYSVRRDIVNTDVLKEIILCCVTTRGEIWPRLERGKTRLRT